MDGHGDGGPCQGEEKRGGETGEETGGRGKYKRVCREAEGNGERE